MFEQRLKELCADIEIEREACEYALLGGGKRLRPHLLLATVEMLGGKNALDAACALEMVHTYSLIHDDLPCMDDDDFRRGKPSLHKAFSEETAVLAGDLLLTYAFEVIANCKLAAEQRIALVQVLARRSGHAGMVKGQVLDMRGAKELDEIESIHLHKTGALIAASVEMGGIIANCDDATMNALKRYGEKIGLAFQIIDDVLDVTSIKNKRGGNSSSDLERNKTTYATLLGVEAAEKLARQYMEEATEILKTVEGESAPLETLTHSLVVRKC